jgi:hypothetical protein
VIGERLREGQQNLLACRIDHAARHREARDARLQYTAEVALCVYEI